MRIRYGWLLATAAAYGVVGGWLLYSHIWDSGHGLEWTEDAVVRISWAVAVFLFSTTRLARREGALSTGSVALHAVVAFLLGSAAGWGVLEYKMAGDWHGWEFDSRAIYSTGAPRHLIMRQTLAAVSVACVAVAALAPLVAWAARWALRRSAGAVR